MIHLSKQEIEKIVRDFVHIPPFVQKPFCVEPVESDELAELAEY